LVKIEDLPFLVSLSIISSNTYSLTFFIFGSCNIKYFHVGPIGEFSIFILEDLEPSTVGAPDLHVVSFSSTLDIEGLVVVSSSDSQRLLVEIPLLSISSIWSLDDHISVVDQVEISIGFECRDNIECAINVKTELLVKLTLSWFLLILIYIDNSPSLLNLSIPVHDYDILVLIVNSSRNFNDLSSIIGNESIILKSKKLPPS
jgi:hypothetical protein